MRRLAFIIMSGLLFAGCAGNLDNPGDFSRSGAGGGTTPPGNTVEMVFEESCGNSVCHDADAPAAGLDLVSANLEGRTVGVSSTDAGCSDEVLVVPGEPDLSYLLAKILASPGICGGQMPIGTLLSADDTEVVRQWILGLGVDTPGIDEGLGDEV